MRKKILRLEKTVMVGDAKKKNGKEKTSYRYQRLMGMNVRSRIGLYLFGLAQRGQFVRPGGVARCAGVVHRRGQTDKRCAVRDDTWCSYYANTEEKWLTFICTLSRTVKKKILNFFFKNKKNFEKILKIFFFLILKKKILKIIKKI